MSRDVCSFPQQGSKGEEEGRDLDDGGGGAVEKQSRERRPSSWTASKDCVSEIPFGNCCSRDDAVCFSESKDICNEANSVETISRPTTFV